MFLHPSKRSDEDRARVRELRDRHVLGFRQSSQVMSASTRIPSGLFLGGVCDCLQYLYRPGSSRLPRSYRGSVCVVRVSVSCVRLPPVFLNRVAPCSCSVERESFPCLRRRRARHEGSAESLHSVFFAKQLGKKKILCSSTIRPFIQMIERDQNPSLGVFFP